MRLENYSEIESTNKSILDRLDGSIRNPSVSESPVGRAFSGSVPRLPSAHRSC
jgi:hypothetical protein